MADGFLVDLGALENAASGVDDTLNELARGGVGRLGGDASDYGHEQLAATVDDFGKRWEIAIEQLAADGREVAQRLDQSVQDYLAADHAARGRLDGIFASATEPDPAAG